MVFNVELFSVSSKKRRENVCLQIFHLFLLLYYSLTHILILKRTYLVSSSNQIIIFSFWHFKTWKIYSTLYVLQFFSNYPQSNNWSGSIVNEIYEGYRLRRKELYMSYLFLARNKQPIFYFIFLFLGFGIWKSTRGWINFKFSLLWEIF